MHPDGSSLVNLTNNLANDQHPSLSGNLLLAFSSNRYTMEGNEAGGSDIYLLNLGSKELTRVLTDFGDEDSPSITTSGGRLAFVSSRDGDSDIFAVEISSREEPSNSPENLTDNPAEDRDPA